MIRSITCVALALTLFATISTATVFSFNTDPFAGSTALTTPGRQVVGAESFITFNPATDVFSFDPGVFGVTSPLSFLNTLGASIPGAGANVIVLQDTPTPFAAGIAADLIAGQVTTSGPGFFIYFNSGLDLARLVYSTDLSDSTADLKVLARLTNLSGQAGRDALPTFTSANFVAVDAVPEPASVLTTATALLAFGGFALRRRKPLVP